MNGSIFDNVHSTNGLYHEIIEMDFDENAKVCLSSCRHIAKSLFEMGISAFRIVN